MSSTRATGQLTLTALLLAGLAWVLLSPAQAAVPSMVNAVAPVTGDLLPVRPQTGLRSSVLLSASDQYVMHQVAQLDESTAPVFSIVRRSDGRTVRTVSAVDYEAPSYGSHLVDDQVVTLGRVSGPMGNGAWTVSDPETGVVASRVDLSPFNSPIRVGDRWAMVYGTPAERDPTSHDQAIDLVRPDGTHREVLGVDGSVFRRQDLTYVGGDEDTAYLQSALDVVEVDVATAVARYVAVPGPVTANEQVAVTPHRLLFWSRAYDSSGDHYVVSWRDRSGSGAGTFEVPFDHHDLGLVPLGDGLAQKWFPDGGSASPLMFDLRPIEDDGTVEPAVVSNLGNVLPTADGHLWAVRGEEGSGEIITVAPGDPAAVDDVARLPVLDDQAVAVTLSRGTVYATWDDSPQLLSLGPGSSSWTPTSPMTPTDTASYPSGGFQQAGDEVLTLVDRPTTGSIYTYELSWPGGSRTVSARWGGIALGRGGDYLVRLLPDGSATQVEQARTGGVVRSLDADADVLLDGSWVWSVAGDALHGTDLSGHDSDRLVAVSPTCHPDLELRAVAGRWAQIDCNGSMQILDLQGRMSPWVLPPQRHQLGFAAELGGDSYAWVDTSPDASGIDQVVLHVVDFSVDHHERTYGLLRGQSWPPGSSFAFDDDGSHALAYVDPRGQVRSVTLDWLEVPSLTQTTPEPSPTPTPPVDATPVPVHTDTTPPTLRPVTGAGAVAWTLRTTLFFGLGATDPSGVVGYEVRTRSSTLGNALGPWAVQPAVTSLTVSVPAAAGETHCVSFRATDGANNVSEWSPQTCTSLPADDTALAAAGRHGRRRDRQALGGSYTILRRHASLSMGDALGGNVMLWLMRSPDGGTCTVSIGGHRLGSVALRSRRSGDHVAVLANPHHWTGLVRLAPAGTEPVGVDAVALMP